MSHQFEYEQILRSYTMKQFAYLPVEGAGVNGSFFFKGSIVIRENTLFVSAMGFTAVQSMGDVNYSMNALVMVNNVVITQKILMRGAGSEIWENSQYKPIGSATFVLPTSDSPTHKSPPDVVLILRGSYFFKAPAGRAVPMPSYCEKKFLLTDKGKE